MNKNSILQKAALVIISALLSLFILELLLRLVYPARAHYFVWQPGLQHHFYPDTTIITGVEPVTNFTIDQYGLRTDSGDLKNGPDLFQPLTDREKQTGAKYYLCLGASTTEGLYLDNSKTWPAQFELAAKAANDSSYKFIGNLAKSGCTMRENYIHLKYAVPQYRRINTVFVMAGLNDMTRRLSQDTAWQNDFSFTPEIEDSFVSSIFLKQGRGEGRTWLRRTALFYVFQNAYHHSAPLSVDWQVQDSSGYIYNKWRDNRKHAARFIDTLPDMSGAIKEYAYIINLMIDEAEKQHIKIVFLNESAIWRDTMTEYELSRLWQGGKGKFQKEPGHVYYSPKALRQGLVMYNQALAKVCMQRHVGLIDIDSQLPHNLTVFYDDCHFNMEGTQRVGSIVFSYMHTH